MTHQIELEQQLKSHIPIPNAISKVQDECYDTIKMRVGLSACLSGRNISTSLPPEQILLIDLECSDIVGGR